MKRPRPASRVPKRAKGRYARVWLSPEFVAWSQRNSLKPDGVAPAVLHTYALQSPGMQSITIVSDTPGADERIFDQPKEDA